MASFSFMRWPPRIVSWLRPSGYYWSVDGSQDSATQEELSECVRPAMFSGLRGVELPGDADVDLGSGFSLTRPNEDILSACENQDMTRSEFAEAASVGAYLVYREGKSALGRTYEDTKRGFQCGVLALQAIKPVRTCGICFYGHYTPGGRFSLQCIERRPPMEPGEWALKRAFGEELIKELPSTIARIQTIMNGPSAEKKNAFHLLQLGLEHFHPLIAGLLWVMGIEAIFNSRDRQDFKNKLCDRLGPSTRIFPEWSTDQPNYTVEETAIPLYTLRSKVAHGVDLRKAASEPKFPVDLLQKHTLTSSSEPVPYALILSEAACYLLCQVLKTEIVSIDIKS